jgi:putative addiction module component (TIGR02574 family)
MSMAIDAKALGIQRMSVEERLELLDLLLDSLESEGVSPGLSGDQVVELERRVADMEANPDDVVDWQEVESQALARIRK